MAYATFPNENVAEQICEQLVREGLIACANILPSHQAIYVWQDRLHKEPEVGAWMKTSIKKKTALKGRLQGLHPFENPCLVFLKLEDGLPDFLNWVYRQTL